MAKITEKALAAMTSAMNSGVLRDTAVGLKAERQGNGTYTVSMLYRTGGATSIVAEDLTASEAAQSVIGFGRGVELGAQAKHVFCPKCGAKANLIPEDEITKEHIYCPTCGKKSPRGVTPG